MPALRISTNGGEGKARRNPRVALGNTKTSGDVKTLNRRSSTNVDKAHMKARFVRDDDRTMESKMNSRSKETKIRGNENGSVLHVGLKEKSGEKRVRKKNDFRKGSQRSEMVNDKSLGRKRKTTSADPRIVEYTMVHGFHEKTIFKSKNRVSGSHLNRGQKKTSRGENGESDHTSRNSSTMGGRKFKGKELLDKNIRAGNVGEAGKWKKLRKSILGNGTPKISDKIKTSLGAKKDLDRRTYAGVPDEKPRLKNDRVKKSLVNGSDMTNASPQPKKKKRVIKIDSSDASNKRLDDGVANNANQSKMKPEEKNNAEMSKNAQFRAICPSPSILSFVEENLLGRRRDIEIRRAGYNTQLSAPLDNIPFSTCSERERIEIPVFRNKLEFFASAKMSSSFPSPVLPEIAFAGRSNVGKSSLLNALTRQWGVVRTSDKPGLTQSINFFKLGPKLSLVDLPGYGFAYAKEEVKEAWEELVKEYVSTRVGLKRVCVLVDTKWGLKPRDLELIDLMESSQTKYQVVLTKTDLVFPIDVARRAMQIEENLKAKKSAVQPLMMVSSKTGAGIRSLRTVLANVARFVR